MDLKFPIVAKTAVDIRKRLFFNEKSPSDYKKKAWIINFIKQLIYILRFFEYVAGKIKTITNQKKQGKKKMENVTEKNISKSNDEKPKVGFIVGNEWLRQCDRIPKVQHRVGF